MIPADKEHAGLEKLYPCTTYKLYSFDNKDFFIPQLIADSLSLHAATYNNTQSNSLFPYSLLQPRPME